MNFIPNDGIRLMKYKLAKSSVCKKSRCINAKSEGLIIIY